ncbi:MAG TPA: acetylxylan esterase [Bryobacteraceae bacterium]|nr:acetylxylan esterase [Bryobacteraceae bacterium]
MRLLALCLLAALSTAAAAEPGARLLGWMDGIAQSQLDRRAETIAHINSTAAAADRQKEVRARILAAIGGLPDYNGPLNAKITGRIDEQGYSIEKLYFESLPGLWVTANLYRPSAAGRHPGVLLPLGHWDEGKPVAQRLAGNLALKGFVVLVYDPLGQGERLQAYDARLGASLAGASVEQHFMAGAQALLIGQSFARYRIWDAKRALDYLVSRPEVDGARIGCTGCSGGGTVATYISALDPRIKVAAPACYMNTFRLLFSGPVGDSEQSLPGFLSSGLDLTDYVELFAPKPWLLSSTIGDFFPLEGARQVYEEARRWYRLYGAEDRIRWSVGPGEHGTPREIREGIYSWFIRWLKDGQGDPAEQAVTLHPDFELLATRSGQVATEFKGRDIDAVLREELEKRKTTGTAAELSAALAKLSPAPPPTPPQANVLETTPSADLITERIRFETEPGLELDAVRITPRSPGRKPGVLLVETQALPSPLALELARAGAVVLALQPRGEPAPQEAGPRAYAGDWLANTRAWLIGRNLPGLRAYDIRRGVSLLAAHPDVDPARLRAVARRGAGVWLLMAAALDARIGGIWLDRTPWSLRAALANPLHRDLHDAVLPGFILRWDFDDLVKAVAPRPVLWTDPTDWMGAIQPRGAAYRYRTTEATDQPWIEALLR